MPDGGEAAATPAASPAVATFNETVAPHVEVIEAVEDLEPLSAAEEVSAAEAGNPTLTAMGSDGAVAELGSVQPISWYSDYAISVSMVEG